MNSVDAFWATIDRVNGAYLDANAGFHAFREQVANVQAQAIAAYGLTQTELDARSFYFGRGDPDNPSSVVQHLATQGQVKERNRKNGENALFLGSMCVVAIYQFWEDGFRNAIASEMKVARDDLKHNLLGDLRLIRNSIVHNRGVAKKEVERCTILKWFTEGDEILLDEDKMHDLVLKLRDLCSEWNAQLSASCK